MRTLLLGKDGLLGISTFLCSQRPRRGILCFCFLSWNLYKSSQCVAMMDSAEKGEGEDALVHKSRSTDSKIESDKKDSAELEGLLANDDTDLEGPVEEQNDTEKAAGNQAKEPTPLPLKKLSVLCAVIASGSFSYTMLYAIVGFMVIFNVLFVSVRFIFCVGVRLSYG